MTTVHHSRARNPLQWFAHGGWYFFVVVLSFGILSPIPFAHAAARLRNPLHWLTPVVYIAAVVFAFASTRPNDPSSPGAWIAMTVLLVSVVHLIWLRRQVWPVGGAAPARSRPAVAEPATVDPAVAAALAARDRRAGARKIVANDPLLARELKIGRPDLRRDYDDGGLVDLNWAPAAAIADICGIDPGLAGRVVEARTASPFTQVDDVFAYVDMPVGLWDRVRDRAVVVTG